MADTDPEIESAWSRYPGYRIDLVPCRGTARVRVGATLVAESEAALRVIETDHLERLYFPRSDVRMDLLAPNDHQSVCPFKGRASYWSFADARTVVEDLFWTYADPFDEVAGIHGHLGVYHEKATVEIESGWSDGSSSRTGFPFWGDQEDLVHLLDVHRLEPGRFVAPGYHVRDRNVVEGGQLLGQAIVAAARSVPEQRVTWASMTFPKAATFNDPIELAVEELRRGRTFSTVSLRSEQRRRLVAPSMILLDRGAPDTIRDVAEMPAIPGPEQALPYDMWMTGRDLRIVDGAYSPDPDRIGPPVIHAWMRWRDDPAEPGLRQALLAQPTTHWTIAAGMRPHRGFGEAQAHVTLSTAPVAVTVAFHDDARLDKWVLYSTKAIWSGRGLVQGEGRVFTGDGLLVASYALQAMVREMLPFAGDRDATTAM